MRKKRRRRSERRRKKRSEENVRRGRKVKRYGWCSLALEARSFIPLKEKRDKKGDDKKEKKER